MTDFLDYGSRFLVILAWGLVLHFVAWTLGRVMKQARHDKVPLNYAVSFRTLLSAGFLTVLFMFIIKGMSLFVHDPGIILFACLAAAGIVIMSLLVNNNSALFKRAIDRMHKRKP